MSLCESRESDPPSVFRLSTNCSFSLSGDVESHAHPAGNGEAPEGRNFLISIVGLLLVGFSDSLLVDSQHFLSVIFYSCSSLSLWTACLLERECVGWRETVQEVGFLLVVQLLGIL